MKWFCVIALWVFSVAPARFSSSESEALQQAFVLVDLLKAEYARLNKQNSFLKAGVPLSTPEQPTCPTTQRPANNDHSFTLDVGSIGVPSRRLLNNLTPGSAYNIQKHSRLKNRRLEYDDMFGPHPGEEPKVPTSPTQPTSILATSSSASPTPPPTREESTSLTASEVTQHLSTRSSIDYEQTRKAKTEGNKAIKLKLTQQKKPTSRDPVIEQVASEIMNEMKDKTISTFKVEIAPLFTARTERYTRFDNVKDEIQ
ncbi:uncharacterized protein LOC125062610 [Pieris napi]|uniref:uncharacterized protein LOC125062610 n=1 Tax=Pieris napi TaxID=78633 RepID=UPI001FB9D963|nr:uncharacterized protein LOC125062610 [Pieris napi]